MTVSVINQTRLMSPPPPPKIFMKKDELMAKTQAIMDRANEIKARPKWDVLDEIYADIAAGKDQ